MRFQRNLVFNSLTECLGPKADITTQNILNITTSEGTDMESLKFYLSRIAGGLLLMRLFRTLCENQDYTVINAFLDMAYLDQRNSNECVEISLEEKDEKLLLLLLKHDYNTEYLRKSDEEVNRTKAIFFLSKLYEEADKKYREGEPIMTDEEFDLIETELRRLDPENSLLRQVASPIASEEAVDLPIPMPSLDKIDEKRLRLWLEKNQASEYFVSAKLDGISALWHEGRLYTHGSGLKGRDITGFAKTIKGLKRSEVSVRGELILKKSSTSIPEGSIARNVVAGAMNRKSGKVVEGIEFIAYDYLSEEKMKPSKAFEQMERLGFSLPLHDILKKDQVNVEMLKHVFDTLSDESAYELDGIVVVPNVPRNNHDFEVKNFEAVSPKDKVAWKIKTERVTQERKVIKVEWNVQAKGSIKPIVIFEEGMLDGGNLTSASGYNAKWIYDNEVGPDAIVKIERANMTIPRIISVVKPAPDGPQMPEQEFEWRGVEAFATEDSSEQEIAKLIISLNALRVKDVGPSMVKNLYESGFDTVGKIYKATQEDFEKMKRVGKKSAIKLYDGLRHGMDTWDDVTFMVASCVFPRLVGETKLRLIYEQEPNPFWRNVHDINIKGISKETVQAIVDSLPDFYDWFDENIKDIWTPKEKPKVTENPLIFVFSGFRDSDLEAFLRKEGHVVKDSVTKDVNYVIYKDNMNTEKVKKAREYGIKVMSLEDLTSQQSI